MDKESAVMKAAEEEEKARAAGAAAARIASGRGVLARLRGKEIEFIIGRRQVCWVHEFSVKS